MEQNETAILRQSQQDRSSQILNSRLLSMPANRTIDSEQVCMALFIREHWSLYLSRESFLVALDASCRAYHADLSSGDFMSEKTGIERRTLLRAITAASGTALSSALPSRHVAAQPASRATAADSGHFETAENQDRRQHHFHKTIWKRISAAHGARLSPDQPGVTWRRALRTATP